MNGSSTAKCRSEAGKTELNSCTSVAWGPGMPNMMPTELHSPGGTHRRPQNHVGMAVVISIGWRRTCYVVMIAYTV
jgi:hypothetical protein